MDATHERETAKPQSDTDEHATQRRSSRKRSSPERIAEAIRELDEAVKEDAPRKLEHKVAWILSRYPAARDSDIELQIRYWEHFESHDGCVFPLGKADLWRFSRLTSLSRVRARIQNTYRRFIASPEIRRRRGKLSKAERQLAVESAVRAPTLQVFADESGKGEAHLVVGSIWVFDPREFTRMFPLLYAWQEAHGIGNEYHFKTLDRGRLHAYMKLIELIADHTDSIGFKSISVANEGFKHVDPALEGLFLHLLLRGVNHEHSTGRSPLPRSLSFTKDADGPDTKGKDALLCERLRAALEQESVTKYGGDLELSAFEAIDSEFSPFVQIADLYTGSIARSLNYPESTKPKDEFARSFLRALGVSVSNGEVVASLDVAHHVAL